MKNTLWVIAIISSFVFGWLIGDIIWDHSREPEKVFIEPVKVTYDAPVVTVAPVVPVAPVVSVYIPSQHEKDMEYDCIVKRAEFRSNKEMNRVCRGLTNKLKPYFKMRENLRIKKLFNDLKKYDTENKGS